MVDLLSTFDHKRIISYTSFVLENFDRGVSPEVETRSHSFLVTFSCRPSSYSDDLCAGTSALSVFCIFDVFEVVCVLVWSLPPTLN